MAAHHFINHYQQTIQSPQLCHGCENLVCEDELLATKNYFAAVFCFILGLSDSKMCQYLELNWGLLCSSNTKSNCRSCRTYLKFVLFSVTLEHLNHWLVTWQQNNAHQCFQSRESTILVKFKAQVSTNLLSRDSKTLFLCKGEVRKDECCGLLNL